MFIRRLNKAEIPMIQAWWSDYKEVAPTDDMLPLDSTFVIEDGNEPLACITVYLTNSTRFAMLDNLVARPGLIKARRHKAVQQLVTYCESFARIRGFKSLFCMAMKEKLAKRYNEMGYNITAQEITTLVKEL